MLSWLLSMQLECINLTAKFTKPMFRLDCRSSEQNSQPTNYCAHVEDFYQTSSLLRALLWGEIGRRFVNPLERSIKLKMPL